MTGNDLAQIWRGVSLLPHMAGCACAGPHLTLDRYAIEADLIAYLAQSYRDADQVALARFVVARENGTEPRPTFAAWLAAIDTSPLDEPDRSRLIADLERALDSFRSANAGGGFVCQ